MTLLNRSSNSSTNALGSNAPFSISNGQATLQLFVLTLAIVGNSFIILAYCRTFKMRTTTNTLVVNLCMADFFSSISEVPYWSVQLVDNRIYVNNNIFCKAMLAVEDLFQVASCLAMCGIAFDRYLALVKGLKGKMTRTRIRVAIAWTWAQSLIAAVPWGILQPTNNERCLRFPHYYEPGIHFRSANILLKSLFIVLPILFTYYVFFRIIKAVRRRRRLGIENNYVQRNWSAEKFAVMRTTARQKQPLFCSLCTLFVLSFLCGVYLGHGDRGTIQDYKCGLHGLPGSLSQTGTFSRDLHF